MEGTDLMGATPKGLDYVPCKAKAKSGRRCRNRPIPGGTVCRTHGGSAPQVKRSARLRLLELVDPAIATLAREMTMSTDPRVRLRAAEAILDRSGHPRGISITTEDARTLLIERLIELKQQEGRP